LRALTSKSDTIDTDNQGNFQLHRFTISENIAIRFFFFGGGAVTRVLVLLDTIRILEYLAQPDAL